MFIGHYVIVTFLNKFHVFFCFLISSWSPYKKNVSQRMILRNEHTHMQRCILAWMLLSFELASSVRIHVLCIYICISFDFSLSRIRNSIKINDLTHLNNLVGEGNGTHSSTLAWKIPWTEEPGASVPGVTVSRARLSSFAFTFHFHH